jgi:signal recognition particle GTPase
VLAAMALLPNAPRVYFIGVGEALEDLQPFGAREFSEALFN